MVEVAHHFFITICAAATAAEWRFIMKNMILGCTLLIIGAIFADHSLGISIPLWIVGLIFVSFSYVNDSK